MITLSVLKWLENNGLGQIDKDLLWQKSTLDRVGVYVTDIGEPVTRGRRKIQSFELISRGSDDVDGYKRLKTILDFMNNNYGNCSLPSVPPMSDVEYKQVTVEQTSTITTVGPDQQGRMIYSAQAKVTY